MVARNSCAAFVVLEFTMLTMVDSSLVVSVIFRKNCSGSMRIVCRQLASGYWDAVLE